VTNAFKLYRRRVIDGIGPVRSRQFNLTVELPLKSIARGYSYVVEPNDWINRSSGVSKLKLRQMGSRYAYILALCLRERWIPSMRREHPPYNEDDHE
jgi:dolichol-phosphate mannosyltransferase